VHPGHRDRPPRASRGHGPVKTISQFFREDLERIPPLERALRFVDRPLQELHDLFHDPDDHIAVPVEVYRQGPSQESVPAYPILDGPWSVALVRAVRHYVREEAQAAVLAHRGEKADRRQVAQRRDALARELDRCLDSCTCSSQGRFYSSIFWLYLSLHTARELCRVPRMVHELDRGLGQEGGDRIKYQVFGRLSALLAEGNMQVNQRIVGELGRAQGEFLSRLVLDMRDNVLIFTEEYIDPDLNQLSSYLAGALGLKAGPFLERLRRTRDFAFHLAGKDGVIQQAIYSFYRHSPEEMDRNKLFFDDRLAELVFRHPKYSRRRYLDREGQKVFRELSARLRAFELLHLLRRRCLLVRERSDGQLQVKSGGRYVRLARDTVTLDFSKPGVMENLVYRHGLMYDITDFTTTLEKLRRSGLRREKTATRHMFLFHELLFELQQAHNLNLEKFLGDGAFYTGISPAHLLAAAVEIQNLYIDLRRRGFVFDRGIRIALNYAHYNLLPVRAASKGPTQYMMEFHGPGLVELSRLTTGKARVELREIKERLIAYGYNASQVHRFFAPMETNPGEDRSGEEFGAWLDQYGTLINEGIVTSRPFVERLSEELGRDPEVLRMEIRSRKFVGFVRDSRFYGVRELGMARLKGLDPQRVYEVESVEGSVLENGTPMKVRRYLDAVDQGYGSMYGADPAD